MAAHWQSAGGEIAEFMNKPPKLVCLCSLDSVSWNNSTLINENVAAELNKRKAAGNGDKYIFGSADLSETLIRDGLFDEYRICIAPVIAGQGRCLFPKGLPVKEFIPDFLPTTDHRWPGPALSLIVSIWIISFYFHKQFRVFRQVKPKLLIERVRIQRSQKHPS